MLSYIFIYLFFQSLVFSQITDINLNINSRIKDDDIRLYLEEFKSDIKFYIVSNNFLDTAEKIKIPLDINIIIESISDNNVISAHVLFSNRTDQILFSDGVDFMYNKGQNNLKLNHLL